MNLAFFIVFLGNCTLWIWILWTFQILTNGQVRTAGIWRYLFWLIAQYIDVIQKQKPCKDDTNFDLTAFTIFYIPTSKFLNILNGRHRWPCRVVVWRWTKALSWCPLNCCILNLCHRYSERRFIFAQKFLTYSS